MTRLDWVERVARRLGADLEDQSMNAVDQVDLQVLGRRHAITAHLELDTEGGPNGVLICEGGVTDGWALCVQDGHGQFVHNGLKLHYARLLTPQRLPPGPVAQRLEFEPNGAAEGGAPRQWPAFEPPR